MRPLFADQVGQKEPSKEPSEQPKKRTYMSYHKQRKEEVEKQCPPQLVGPQDEFNRYIRASFAEDSEDPIG